MCKHSLWSVAGSLLLRSCLILDFEIPSPILFQKSPLGHQRFYSFFPLLFLFYLIIKLHKVVKEEILLFFEWA